MRLSEFTGKEIINLTDAAKLGVVKNADVLVDTETGRVEALLVPFVEEGSLWSRHQKTLAVPWRAVRRMGREVVIVEVRTPIRDEHRRSSTINLREDH